MNNVLILGALAAAVLAVVLWPLVKRGGGGKSQPDGGRAAPTGTEALDDSLAAVALREIELDHQMGRLSDRDFEALRAPYQRELATADSQASPGVVAPAAATRSSGASPAGRADLEARAEALIAQYRDRTSTCPSCGARPEADAAFCSSCGRSLAPCPSCGEVVAETGAKFCPSCGTALVH